MSKIYIIAGESSGDYIGGKIMQSLKNFNPKLKFVGIGGPLMQNTGLSSLFPISEISLMGFFEILPHIFRLNKLINLTMQDIIKSQPDILITIDSPGFSYRVAKNLRKQNSKLCMMHVVAPSVWAYKPGRAKKYAIIYDHLLTLLSFEPPYFTKFGLNCSYIGHPILEQKFYKKDLTIKRELIICVTAGSRKGEIIRHIPIFIAALNILAKQYSDLKVMFVLANQDHQKLIEPFVKDVKFNSSFATDKLKAYAQSNFALAKSGTNTLEIAASGTPMVVAYKVNILSYFIIRMLIKIKYVSLINIINQQEIIPEFIQFNCTAKKLADGLIDLIEKPMLCVQQVEKSFKTLSELGLKQKISPSVKAAEIILKFLKIDYSTIS